MTLTNKIKIQISGKYKGYEGKLNYILESSNGKGSACNVGDLGSILGSGRWQGEGRGNHFSILAWELQRSLVAYSPLGGKELDTSEQLLQKLHH